MSDAAGIVKLAAWVGQTLGTSEKLFADFSTEALGVKLPDTVLQAPAVTGALSHAETAAKQLKEASDELETKATGGDDAELIGAFVLFGAMLAAYFAALANLVDVMRSAITAGSIPDAAARAAADALAGELAKKVADVVIISAIAQTVPQLAYALKLLGLAEWGYKPSDGASSLSRDHVTMALRLDRFKGLVNDPGQHFIDTIGWGASGFDPTDFFQIYSEFFDDEDDVEVGIDSGDPFLRHGGLTVRRASDLMPPGLRAELTGKVELEHEVRTELSDSWGVNLAAELGFEGGATATIEPPMSISLGPFTSEVRGEVRLFVNRNPEARPFDVLAGTDLISLEVEDTAIGAGVEAEWDVVASSASLAPILFAEIKGARLGIGASDSDSFIATLLASANIEGHFDLAIEWHGEDGLRVRGSGGFEIQLPIHASLGIIDIESLYLALRIAGDGTLSLEASAGITGQLGPLAAAVERIGAQLDLRFAEGADADFGPFDMDLKFKPPNGVGLSIDAAIVKGGGYLYFDFEKEEYAGALELVFSGFLTLKAIGLVTTRMPDGSKGFSLLIIITAEFGTGLQLGFGFTLLGVGGLLGLNRTMKLQPLVEGVRTGAVESVMFPRDVVANAPRIISDLRRFFPPAEGIFLIGPMAKLGWSTPPLVTLSLGIIFEIPGNIAILGVLKVALPNEEAPLIKLQVNFLGAIEFDKERLWFFASLFESRVLFITIEGEMGLLVGWGEDSNFVVSVGGFHPQFNPPALPFPSPKRLSFNILNESYGRIRVMGYFAVTSNSVQFGTRAELFFGLSAVNIEGHIGFDALIQFNPFYFIIEISAGVSLKVFGIGLFSISLRFSLEGPSPWRAKGYGKLKILFFSIKANFDFTWGEKEDTTLPPVEVMPLLEAEYEKLDNWKAVVPDANNLSVSLRKLPESAGLVLHPLGRLAVSQRAVPLDIALEKIGSKKPSDANQVSLDVRDGLSKTDDVDEKFAIAQYQEFSDAEKLSKPAFQPLAGGIEMAPAGRGFESGRATKRVVRYETHIIDRQRFRLVIQLVGLAGRLFQHFLGGSAVTKSVLSQKHKLQLQPFEEKISVDGDGYAVAFNRDNSAYSETAVFSSEAKARGFMEAEAANDPALRGSLHVIPTFELREAA